VAVAKDSQDAIEGAQGAGCRGVPLPVPSRGWLASSPRPAPARSPTRVHGRNASPVIEGTRRGGNRSSVTRELGSDARARFAPLSSRDLLRGPDYRQVAFSLFPKAK
jgi:hypothetical protein